MRPDYCHVGGEPCQSVCIEPCSTKRRRVSYVCPICAASMIERDEALLRQALEVLEEASDALHKGHPVRMHTQKAIVALRDRLDQAVADAKIAADELARRIRANKALLDAATAEPNSKTSRTENLGCAMNIRHINAMLHPLSVTRETLSALGFEPAGFDKASILYMVEDFPVICRAIAKRASDAAAVYEKDKNHA